MSDLRDENAESASRWLDQASGDLAVARTIAADSTLPTRTACFSAHLAAEKALKGLLISLGLTYRKVHDLAELRALLPADLVAEVVDADMEILDPWAVGGRYPGDIDEAAPSEAEECIAAAERIVAVAARHVAEA